MAVLGPSQEMALSSCRAATAGFTWPRPCVFVGTELQFGGFSASPLVGQFCRGRAWLSRAPAAQVAGALGPGAASEAAAVCRGRWAVSVEQF